MVNRICSANKRGFTLLEMGIVILVIGLLSGGVIIGSAMIRASQLRTVATDVTEYTRAVINFRDKYMELPGDMYDAESYWGTDPGGCPNTPINTAPKTLTCNGNGDGIIGDAYPVTTHMAEIFRFWQHLANAGMVSGTYSGVRVGSTNGGSPECAAVGIDVPASAVGRAGFNIYSYPSVKTGDFLNTSLLYPNRYGYLFHFGATSWSAGGGCGTTDAPVLTPAEALAIDAKIDDGKPGTGAVLTFNTQVLPNCATDDTLSANYQGSNKANSCSLMFIIDFQ